MILDELKKSALKSINDNKLKLKDFYIGELFTYVLIEDNNSTSIGVALTPNGEGELLKSDFKSLKEILEDKSFNPAARAVALAAINAVGQYELKNQSLDLKEDLRNELFTLIMSNSQDIDKIVFIGNLKPVVKKLRDNSRDVTVFCRTKVEESNRVYNDIFEYEGVSNADIVVITGAALIGSTIDALLKFTSKAKMVIISGFSVGLNPLWLKGTNITHVASLYLEDYPKEEIEKNSLETIFENKCYIQKL